MLHTQNKYELLREKCCRQKLLDNQVLKSKVHRLFLEYQWSPEQISARLAYENSTYVISYNTIYRAIYAGLFDTTEQKRSHGNRGAIRKLRHRGKTRRAKGTREISGKIVISNSIHERPAEADERKVIGHWEADAVIGKRDSACLVTITDRYSRYLLAEKISRKRFDLLADKIISMFSNIPKNRLKTITPDREKEFAKHHEVASSLDNVQFYFPDPHAPWQRGTNENTNGLIREYLPKSFDMATFLDDDIAIFIGKLNKRPRKCLNWKSPYEVFFNKVLHLT